MQLLQKLFNKLNGLNYKQDYLCLDKGTFRQSLHVYIVLNNRMIKKITDHHLFTGYSPLVFAFPAFDDIDFSRLEYIDIVFSNTEFQPNDLPGAKDWLAIISLKRVRQQELGHSQVFFYEGQKGQHRFISSFHQFMIQRQNQLYNKKPGNVYLPGNLLKQVQIAYSIPRIISLITVSSQGLFNLFPTDLHGQIEEGHYIISLRQEGKAAGQVETTGRVLITEIDATFYKTAYSLGKNHMQGLKTKEQFPFNSHLSQIFQLPLPQDAVFWRELALQRYFDHGIHRIFLFKIVNKKQIESNPGTLAHIHNVYATWRQNNGLPGNYLLR